MMYNEKLAIAIKTNGKVLREFGDKVYVPFGSEYSLFIKNTNNVRALVSISIDGEDIADGEQFVVYPNSDLEIERFLRNGNNVEGNRFKFIERSGSVEDHRGIGVEDGLVRVEYWYEKPVVNRIRSRSRSPQWYEYNDILRSQTFGGSVDDGSYTVTSTAAFNADAPVASYTADAKGLPEASVNYAHTMDVNLNDQGITVEGSISDQQFRTVSSFPTEAQSHVMVLKMLGQTEQAQVSQPVTVDFKPECKTCGRKNKATAKFCSNCGTSLQIVA